MDIPVPWQQHDVFFIRAALHLRNRADRAGVLLAPLQLCAGDRFSLSAALAAQAAAESHRRAAAGAYTELLPEMRRMRDKGRSLRAIAAELNGQGHTTRGKAWNPMQVRAVLARA